MILSVQALLTHVMILLRLRIVYSSGILALSKNDKS